MPAEVFAELLNRGAVLEFLFQRLVILRSPGPIGVRVRLTHLRDFLSPVGTALYFWLWRVILALFGFFE